MNKTLLASIVGASLLITLHAQSEYDGPVELLQKQLAASSRSDADKARDAGRKPAAVVTFLGFGERARILDVIAAGGYYTEVLSIAVGPWGKVHAQNPAVVLKFREGANDKALTQRLADQRLPNVVRWDRELDNLQLNPGSFDGAITALNFHDVYNRNPEAAARMLSAIRRVLKPGGVLGIIDHVGDPGNDNASLHRIPEAVVIEAAKAASFEVVATSDLLRNPDDDHTKGVFDPAVRGKTDRFLLKLRRPE